MQRNDAGGRVSSRTKTERRISPPSPTVEEELRVDRFLPSRKHHDPEGRLKSKKGGRTSQVEYTADSRG